MQAHKAGRALEALCFFKWKSDLTFKRPTADAASRVFVARAGR